jgi:hypothetical protein
MSPSFLPKAAYDSFLLIRYSSTACASSKASVDRSASPEAGIEVFTNPKMRKNKTNSFFMKTSPYDNALPRAFVPVGK